MSSGRLTRVMSRMSPGAIVKSHMSSNVVKRFADKVGMVYFGSINHTEDEYRLVRGHTVSKTHQDDNYCVGTLRGYDVMLVSRSDSIVLADKNKKVACHWLIAVIDLHSLHDAPYVYIGHELHGKFYQSSAGRMSAIALHPGLGYSDSFSKKYTIYAVPTHTQRVLTLLYPEMANVFMSHFSHTSIELDEGSIYLYIQTDRPTEQHIESVVTNGLWLAGVLDARLAQMAEAGY